MIITAPKLKTSSKSIVPQDCHDAYISLGRILYHHQLYHTSIIYIILRRNNHIIDLYTILEEGN